MYKFLSMTSNIVNYINLALVNGWRNILLIANIINSAFINKWRNISNRERSKFDFYKQVEKCFSAIIELY